MDIIYQCLSLAPVPYLAPAFSVLRFIYSSVEQAQASKQQLQALSQTIAQLLWTLNKEYRSERLLYAKTSTAIDDLGRFVISTVPYILVSYQCISQITPRDLGIRSERGLMPISEATVHQRSKDCSDRAIPQAYHDCGYFISGKS